MNDKYNITKKVLEGNEFKSSTKLGKIASYIGTGRKIRN